MEVDFRCTPLGFLFDPRLDVRIDGDVHAFWLERGGRGVRYLVVPGSDSDSELEVVGHRARVEGDVRIVAAGAGGIPDGPLLIVAPHPDDAEIASYGLYRDRPAQTHIVVATTGDRGKPYGVRADRPGGWVAWARRFDALTVPQMAGVAPNRVASLNWPEEAFAKGGDSAACGDLERQLAAIVDRVKPVAVVMPHPVLESHPVHLAVTAATLRALRRTGSGAEALFVLIHVPQANRYPLGPPRGAVPLPPCYDGEEHFERLVCHSLSPIVRAEKVFALDAHHDLRPAPLPFARRESLFRLARRRLAERIGGVQAVASSDYFRRAVRPYELFLGVSAEGCEEYLARLEARRTR